MKREYANSYRLIKKNFERISVYGNDQWKFDRFKERIFDLSKQDKRYKGQTRPSELPPPVDRNPHEEFDEEDQNRPSFIEHQEEFKDHVVDNLDFFNGCNCCGQLLTPKELSGAKSCLFCNLTTCLECT